jgi:hypothetical protein
MKDTIFLQHMLAYPNHSCISSIRRNSLSVESKYLALELEALSFKEEDPQVKPRKIYFKPTTLSPGLEEVYVGS